jgi:hypothetical protein
MSNRRGTLTVEAMTQQMCDIIPILNPGADLPCRECGKPAAFITAFVREADGTPVPEAFCANCLPGDENQSAKHLPPLALAVAGGGHG